MSIWNDTENTELTGEITEGYFSEGSGNVRDAPKKKHRKKKGRIQDPGINDSPAFTEDDSRIFTPDSRKSFVESRKAEGVGNDESSVTENFSVSRTKSSNSKSSENKKKEYRKRLKAKAKEKRKNQRKLAEEEARKNAEPDVLNTCKSGGNKASDIRRSVNDGTRNVSGNVEKESVAGYEGNGLFYADPVKKSDTTGNSNKSEASKKKTSLTLFGSDDKDSISNSPHGTSRRVVGKLSDTGIKTTEYSIRKTVSAISKATGEKDDNAGADAMRLAEQGGETVSRYGFYVAKDVKDKAFEESTKTIKQVSDYTTDSVFDTAKKELSKEEKKKLAYKKALRKKRRKAYQKAKKVAKETGKKTYEGTKETAKAIKAVVRLVARTVFAIPRAILIIILLIIVLLLIGGEIAGSTVSLVTEAASIMSAATYQSSPQMIDQADLEFSYMELMLRDRIDEIEDDYPDYDEYSYTLGSIGHDPFTLINYLHAEYGTINSDAMAGLNDLFNAMYELKLTPTEETRYRLVPKPPEEDDEDDFPYGF